MSVWLATVSVITADEGRPLPGTVGAADVTYSPDGRWIAFKVETDLYKVPVFGGPPVRLLAGVDPDWMAITWMQDGTILCEQEGFAVVQRSSSGYS